MQAEEYAKMRALEDRYWWFVSRRRLAQVLLRRHAPEAVDVLDLGCGTGALLADLAPHYKAMGLDFSDQALGFSRERGHTALVRANAERLPLSPGCFDAVVSLDTLEHVADHEAAMREVARVLRRGGTAVINVPAFQWLWGPHDVALMHHRRYTRRQLADIVRAAGLKPIKMSYSVFFLFPVVVALRAVDKFRRGPAEVKLPMVPAFANRLLVGLQDMESWLIGHGTLPWGSSVVAVARKP